MFHVRRDSYWVSSLTLAPATLVGRTAPPTTQLYCFILQKSLTGASMYDMWVWVKTSVARKVAAMTRLFIPNSSGHMEVVPPHRLPLIGIPASAVWPPSGHLRHHDPRLAAHAALAVDMDMVIPMESDGQFPSLQLPSLKGCEITPSCVCLAIGGSKSPDRHLPLIHQKSNKN